MAITFRGASAEGLDQLVNLLKIWYKDGVTNLLYRNSPLLKMITKEHVEGSEQDFNAMYGRGGAVSANFKYASEAASETIRDAVFKISPGQIFSCYSVTAKEIVAAKTQRGAFMPIAGAKMFSAMEAFRKTIAATLYGMGYGEIAYIKFGALTAPNTFRLYNKTSGEAIDSPNNVNPNVAAGEMLLPLDAVMKIDVNSRLKVKNSISGLESTDAGGWLKVTRIGATKKVNGVYCNLVSFDIVSSTNVTFGANELVLALRGGTATDGNGKDPWFPVGLSAWLPYVGRRDDASWTTYINDSFMGVDRKASVDRLAGQFAVQDAATTSMTPIADTILALMDMCRTAGSTADMIVMNNKDYQALSKELTPYTTYGIYSSDIKNKGKNTPTFGMSGVQFGLSTSWVEKVIDDPYCPRGVIYVLDSDMIKLWTYTNVDSKLQSDGVPGNEPGKPDVMSEQSDATPEKPYQLLLNDLMTVDQGDDTVDGAAARVTINFFGAFVLLDPAACGSAILYNKEGRAYFEPIGSKLYAV